MRHCTRLELGGDDDLAELESALKEHRNQQVRHQARSVDTDPRMSSREWLGGTANPYSATTQQQSRTPPPDRRMASTPPQPPQLDD